MPSGQESNTGEVDAAHRGMQRREFLTKIGVMLGAIGLTGRKPIRGGVVQGRAEYKAAIIGRTGAGDYGHGLDRVFNRLEDVHVSAVADVERGGAREAAEVSGADRIYLDYEKMLVKERPDLVSIATRQPQFHRDMALAAIDVGAHIYMEKPITETPAEADAIIEAAERQGVKIAVGHVRRLMPEFLNPGRLLEQRIIGIVLEVRGYGKMDQRVGGEDLIVLGTHDFDLWRLYFGDPEWCFATVTTGSESIRPEDVRRGREPYLVAGDTIRAQYEFPGGIRAYWSSIAAGALWNRNSRVPGDPMEGRERWGFDILGTEGNLYYRSGQGFRLLRTHYLVPGVDDIHWEELPEMREPLPDYKTHPIRNLIRAVEEDTEPFCSARDARWTVEMVSAVYQSQIAREPVGFPLEYRQHPLERFQGCSG